MPDRNWRDREPSPDELSAEFIEWLFKQASRLSGVLRTEINARFGTQRRWTNYLKVLAKQRGYVLVRQMDALDHRYIRFFIK